MSRFAGKVKVVILCAVFGIGFTVPGFLAHAADGTVSLSAVYTSGQLSGQPASVRLLENVQVQLVYIGHGLRCTDSGQLFFWAIRDTAANQWAAHGLTLRGQYEFDTGSAGTSHSYEAYIYCAPQDIFLSDPNPPVTSITAQEHWQGPKFEADTGPAPQQPPPGNNGNPNNNNNNTGTNNGNAEFVQLVNPLRFSNIELTTPGQIVQKGFQGFAAIIALIAIAFVVFSGVKLMVARSEEAVKVARESTTWAVGGFVVALLAFTIISGAANFLNFDPSLIGQDELVNPIRQAENGNIFTGPLVANDFVSVMNFVMIRFLGLVGFLATANIIFEGYKYLVSQGNEEKVRDAKGGLKWSMLGLAVILLAFTLIASVRQIFIRFGDIDTSQTSQVGSPPGQGSLPPTPPPPGFPPDIQGKIQAAAALHGLDDVAGVCLIQTIVNAETRGQADGVGHDHTKLPFPIQRWSLGDPSNTKADERFPASLHDPVDRSQSAAPIHNLDWSFSHGIGLMQITIFPRAHYLGQSGWLDDQTPAREFPDGSGKRHTVLDLFNVDTQIDSATEQLSIFLRRYSSYKEAIWRYIGRIASVESEADRRLGLVNTCIQQAGGSPVT